MTRVARLGCCSPDMTGPMREALLELVRIELGIRARMVGIVVVTHDDPELASVRRSTADSPVWPIMDSRPDAVVVLAWAEVVDA